MLQQIAKIALVVFLLSSAKAPSQVVTLAVVSSASYQADGTVAREPRPDEIPEAKWQWPETDFHAKGFTAGQKAIGVIEDGVSNDPVTRDALRRIGAQKS